MKLLITLIPIVALSACAQRNINTEQVTTAPLDAQPLYDVNGNINATAPAPSGVVTTPDGVTVAGYVPQDGVDPNASFRPSYDGSIQSNPNEIVLSDYTQDQQQRDREAFAARMAQIAAQRQEVTTASVPDVPSVNVAAYARSTSNAVGQSVYSRSGKKGSCNYPSSVDAQRVFLESGGPANDPKGLDPDGDGFACSFNPAIYRQIR